MNMAAVFYTGEKGRETAKTQPEPAFGWLLTGWVLEGSFIFSRVLPMFANLIRFLVNLT